MFYFFILILLSCTHSTKIVSDRTPTEILKCSDLKERIKTRANLIQRVEGTALVRDKSGRWQLYLSLRSDNQFWIEIRSPFGAPFAILKADELWVEFIIPRRKELYRIPSAEFWRSTPRQKSFLEILPIQIKPDAMYETLMGRLAFQNLNDCRWLRSEKSYVIGVTSNGKTRRAWLDPKSYFPIQYGSKEDDFYIQNVEGAVRIASSVEFGASFEAFQRGKKEFTFEWSDLSWSSELGPAPPAFPNLAKYKILNY